jgi:2-polyprenyl-6-methoxyphenol hydroxylase-like FAD-dependent oxidoreductase
MRVLIVGAGIAGMSLAAMLRLRGIESLLIERARPEEDAGYVIGLWPIGTRVLHGLNLYEEFVREALPMRTYRLCNGKGELIKEFSLERIAAEFGYIGLLERQLLIRLLQSRVSPGSIRWGVTVETLAQSRDEVYVTLGRNVAQLRSRSRLRWHSFQSARPHRRAVAALEYQLGLVGMVGRFCSRAGTRGNGILGWWPVSRNLPRIASRFGLCRRAPCKIASWRGEGTIDTHP